MTRVVVDLPDQEAARLAELCDGDLETGVVEAVAVYNVTRNRDEVLRECTSLEVQR